MAKKVWKRIHLCIDIYGFLFFVSSQFHWRIWYPFLLCYSSVSVNPSYTLHNWLRTHKRKKKKIDKRPFFFYFFPSILSSQQFICIINVFLSCSTVTFKSYLFVIFSLIIWLKWSHVYCHLFWWIRAGLPNAKHFWNNSKFSIEILWFKAMNHRNNFGEI